MDKERCEVGKMRIIGLTGGIGTGKTTVSEYLRKKGHVVLDADEIARGLCEKGSPVLLQIARIFGEDMLRADGSLDRKKLADAVFTDTDKKKQLDGLMHKKVFDIMQDEIKNAGMRGAKVVFADVPLLFESGFDRFTQEVWTVRADEAIRLGRVMMRDGLREEDVLRRIRSQMDEEEKQNRSDHILDNSGERKKLYAQIDALLERIEA